MALSAINCVVGEAEYAQASDNVLLPLHQLAHTVAYRTSGNGTGQIDYISVTYSTNVYRQTFTYDSSNRVTLISIWTLQ